MLPVEHLTHSTEEIMKFPFRIHRRRLVRRVVLGLALAAVLVPTAQALPGDRISAKLDPATGLPCTPTCPSFDTASNLPDDTAVHGPGAARTVTIPESLAEREFGPTSAGIGADPVKPTPIKGGFVPRQPQPAGASSDVTAAEIGAGLGIGLAATLLAAAGLAFARRRGNLAQA
jgi:hypothetical protein